MNYTEIDRNRWKRNEYYNHFTKEINCTSSVTSKIEIGKLKAVTKQNGISFYIACLHCVTAVVNAHEEFRTAYLWQEDKVVLWEEVWPSHIVFNKETEMLTRIWSAYTHNFDDFHRQCQNDIENGLKIGGFSVPDVPPNIFDVSCIPWVDYTAVHLNVENTGYIYLAPIITWGKAIAENHSTFMPMTMQIHHSVADGFHIARFFLEVQRAAEALADSIDKSAK